MELINNKKEKVPFNGIQDAKVGANIYIENYIINGTIRDNALDITFVNCDLSGARILHNKGTITIINNDKEYNG